MTKKALVIFSGGQDSTIYLLQAIKMYGQENVETITFQYGQRHNIELDKARKIVQLLQVRQTILDTSVINNITHSALTDSDTKFVQKDGENYPNSCVEGRNALFLLLAGIHAKTHNISTLIIGLSEADSSGYPICRDIFIKSINVTLNLAMNYTFNSSTPLMYLSKAKTWALADQLRKLEFIEKYTQTCYEGIDCSCGVCPSCQLQNRGLATYLANQSNKDGEL